MVVVFGLLPIQPMMLHAPQRTFDELVAATNAELQRYVQAQASPQLRYKGGSRACSTACNKFPAIAQPASASIIAGQPSHCRSWPDCSPLSNPADCGGGFLGADGAVNYELMLDGVHPTGGRGAAAASIHALALHLPDLELPMQCSCSSLQVRPVPRITGQWPIRR